MAFKSKRDWWLVLLIVLSMFGAIAGIIVELETMSTKQGWLMVLSLSLAVVLVVWVLMSTYYEFTSKGLRVVSGPYRKVIPYDSIVAIQPSRSLLSGPALSLDRMRVSLNRGLPLLISPEDKKQFIRKLKSKVPDLVSE